MRGIKMRFSIVNEKEMQLLKKAKEKLTKDLKKDHIMF
jgi:hypothetical protein